MKLSKFKEIVATLPKVSFQLADGTPVPKHFHVTEVGAIHKHFIDCGGTVREEKAVNFQLWYSDDLDHQLLPQRLLNIIALSEKKLGIEDQEIEVEYQADTIGKYGLDFDGTAFVLTNKMTDCLAPDKCEVPAPKKKINLLELVVNNNACTPGGGCC